jgi:hypothetical protein
MSEKMEKVGGYAFPLADSTIVDSCDFDKGMTLRDWFAGQALAGLMARRWEDEHGNVPEGIFNVWASSAYQIADALLTARKETP